jgi:predicted acetyltransferase
MSQLVVKSVDSSQEEQALQNLGMQAFNFDEDRWESYLTVVNREHLRIAVVSQEVVGGMSFYPIGQWFGGKRIPMAGLALVLMAPEHRGRGYAYHMLAEVMRQLRADGYPLATLYASTQRLYRKLGFEQAGNSYTYALSIKDIEVPKQELPMRQVDAQEQRALLQKLATKRAVCEQGCLDRNDGMWNRLFRELNGKVFTYLIGEPGNECGYLIYDQSRDAARSSPGEHAWEQRSINIRDMVALNADAMNSIWAFIGSNRTVTELVKWTGPATDLRSLLPPEYEAKVILPDRWMLRLLDVRRALLDRGYSMCDADVAFEVTDDLLVDNCGSFTLHLRDGVPEIENGASGNAIQINVREFAPLYSGLWTAEQLQRFGLLHCDDDEMVDSATRAFASSEPWMPEAF